MDSLFVSGVFDNPLQQALEEKCRDFLAHETNTSLYIFPRGRTDNQQPLLDHTRHHLDKLHHEPPEKKFLHIGVSGLFNFDLAAAGRHDALLLVDINPAHTRYMKKLVQTLASSQSRAQFVESMSHDAYMRRECIRTLTDMKWMKNDHSFAHLHSLAQQGCIYVAPLDLYDSKQCKKIKEWIDESGFTPATIYTSNIMEHGLRKTQWQLYIEEIAPMNKLSRHQQDEKIYKQYPVGTSYQSNLPSDIAGTLQDNLNLLSSSDTISFIVSELPTNSLTHPRILIEGKVQSPPSSEQRR